MKEWQFQNETIQDEVLSKIMQYCLLAWPKDKNGLNEETKIYFGIFVIDKILFYNNRMAVPESLRKDMLQLLHNGNHFEVTKTKARAKETFYCLGLNRDILEYKKKCQKCETFKPADIREPLITHEIPALPFSTIASDILTLVGVDYLVFFIIFQSFKK